MVAECAMESDSINCRIYIPSHCFCCCTILNLLVEFVWSQTDTANKLLKVAEVDPNVVWKEKVGEEDVFWHPSHWAIPHSNSFSIQQHFFKVLLCIVKVSGPFTNCFIKCGSDVFCINKTIFLISVFSSNRAASLPLCNHIVVTGLLVINDECKLSVVYIRLPR